MRKSMTLIQLRRAHHRRGKPRCFAVPSQGVWSDLLEEERNVEAVGFRYRPERIETVHCFCRVGMVGWAGEV